MVEANSYGFWHCYVKSFHISVIHLISIYFYWKQIRSATSIFYNFLIRHLYLHAFQSQSENFLKMAKVNNILKYFAPLVQLAFCPVTILFLWSVFIAPDAINEGNQELVD